MKADQRKRCGCGDERRKGERERLELRMGVYRPGRWEEVAPRFLTYTVLTSGDWCLAASVHVRSIHILLCGDSIRYLQALPNIPLEGHCCSR